MRPPRPTPPSPAASPADWIGCGGVLPAQLVKSRGRNGVTGLLVARSVAGVLPNGGSAAAWVDEFCTAVDARVCAEGGGSSVGARWFVSVVWALAKLGAAPDPERLTRLLAACSHEGLAHWSAQDLANTLCAFAKLRFNPGQQWLESFGRAVGARAGVGALQELDHFHIQWAWRELSDGGGPAAPALPHAHLGTAGEGLE